MNIHAPQSSGTDPSNHRWIVRLAFRFNDERQVVKNSAVTVDEIVRVWLEDATSDAKTAKPGGRPIGWVRLPTRSAARSFIKVLGGKMITAMPVEIMPAVQD